MLDMDGSSNTDRARGPSLKRVILGAVLALVLALVSVEVITVARNNARFDEWRSTLLHHPAPANATVIDSGSRYGLLWGNGNHCDGEAWVIIRGDLSATELERHYSDLSDIGLRREVTTDNWRVSMETRLGTAGLDLRCN